MFRYPRVVVGLAAAASVTCGFFLPFHSAARDVTIHVAVSTTVTIQSCRIGTGDDCVSIVNGSFGVKMRNIDCGPGHGISIGSLGKGGAFAAVADVALVGRGAQNGVWIKTWQGGAGYMPCTGIVLRDIDLSRDEDDGEVQTVCNCAVGFDYGRVQPAADCLRSSTCGGAPDDHHHHDEEKEQGKDEEAVMHTEL